MMTQGLNRQGVISGGSTLIYDTFEDTNGVLLSAHTPTQSPGSNWSVAAIDSLSIGAVTIQENTAEWDLNTLSYGVAVIESNEADIRISANMIFISPQDQATLVARYTRVANQTYCILVTISTVLNTMIIAERSAGGQVTKASVNIAIGYGTHALELTCIGTTVTARVNNGNEISYTGAILNQTETVHGMGKWNLQHAIDNFKIELS